MQSLPGITQNGRAVLQSEEWLPSPHQRCRKGKIVLRTEYHQTENTMYCTFKKKFTCLPLYVPCAHTCECLCAHESGVYTQLMLTRKDQELHVIFSYPDIPLIHGFSSYSLSEQVTSKPYPSYSLRPLECHKHVR